MANELFLDSSYAIALAARSDQLHPQAIELADQIEKQVRRLITTRAVLLEIGNALSRKRYRTAAVELLTSLETDPAVTVIAMTSELYQNALELFGDRPDKDWSLTDCASFIVMQLHGLSEALTSDVHFEQAGYRALLRKT